MNAFLNQLAFGWYPYPGDIPPTVPPGFRLGSILRFDKDQLQLAGQFQPVSCGAGR